jgi:Viral BACON domain/Putative binding domain, N-terminal
MYRRFIKISVLFGTLGIVLGSCGGDDGGPTEPTPVCSIAISPGTLTFTAEGGVASVTVTAPAGCSWTATASAAWITITAGASGSSAGTVSYSVASNADSSTRTGTLTIGGQTHTLTQEGRAPTVCTYALSPASAEFSKDAASGTFAVSAPSDCPWTAVSSAPWLVVASASGMGNGSVSYSVTRNPDVADRTATIGVADRTFTVKQSGDVAAVCAYSVAPVEFAPCMPGGSVTASVTTQASCSWTVASSASWLGLPSGGSGTGSGVITISFSDNYDAPRDGIIMVRWPTPTAGQNIRVSQAGCTYAVSRSSISFASSGGSGTFDVIQQSVPNTCGSATQDRCVWTATSNVPWITVTSSMPRAGDNPVTFTVAPNTGPAREGRITVRDKVVVITQAAQ